MKHYLIDGNNVVCIWKKVPKPTESQEQEFLQLVKSALAKVDRATVIFDGPPRPNLRGSSPGVRYSFHEKADAVLLRMIQDAPHPEQLVVVSDDRQIREAAKRHRCLRASEFLEMAIASADQGPEKPDKLSSTEREKWLKEFGIEGS